MDMHITMIDVYNIRDAAVILETEDAFDLAAELNEVGDKLAEMLKRSLDTPRAMVRDGVERTCCDSTECPVWGDEHLVENTERDET